MNEERYKTPDDKLTCKDCKAVIEDKVNCLANIIILTEDAESIITLEMKQALNIIEDYSYKKYYHLSASQIVLFRPDIAVKAFKRIFKKPIFFGFEFSILCKSCYALHKVKHPLK